MLVDRRFVSLASPTAGRNGAGFLPCQGLYHTRSGETPRTAVIATHYNVHLERIEIPALVLQSTADTGVFPSDARTICDHHASSDKRLDFVAGDHYLESPSVAREEVADPFAEWLRAHGA